MVLNWILRTKFQSIATAPNLSETTNLVQSGLCVLLIVRVVKFSYLCWFSLHRTTHIYSHPLPPTPAQTPFHNLFSFLIDSLWEVNIEDSWEKKDKTKSIFTNCQFLQSFKEVHLERKIHLPMWLKTNVYHSPSCCLHC